MTEVEAQAKDFAMSHKMNLAEPTVIAHTIELMEDAYIAGYNAGKKEDDSTTIMRQIDRTMPCGMRTI